MRTRPGNIEEFLLASARFATEDGVSKGLSYRPDPTDVFVSPYAKCGTTWMQQIVHGLRTGGSMDFGEITEVVPWIEMAHDLGLDVQAPQVAHPRAFKSHLRWDEIPKGGRYIVVFRDPVDAMVSLYRFMNGWFFENGAVSPDEFADYYLNRAPDKSYWGHASSWWSQRGREDVLLLSYERMKTDLPATVERVADFIGIEDSEARRIATKQAGFNFMKAHEHQFDDHLVRKRRDAACGLPPGGESSKVSAGKAGAGAALLTPDIRENLEAKWQATMGAQFGLAGYVDLASSLER